MRPMATVVAVVVLACGVAYAQQELADKEEEAPPKANADEVQIKVVNAGDLELQLWRDTKPKETKRKLKPGETVDLTLKTGHYAMTAGTWVGGRAKPGIGNLVGVVVVKGPEKWEFSLKHMFGQRSWQMKTSAIEAKP